MSKGTRNLSNALLLIFSVAILIGLLVLALLGAGLGSISRSASPSRAVPKDSAPVVDRKSVV
mgnify:CR=1 FL=1